MDLRQLGYVVAIVDNGGFTRAADELGVAQPSLSQSVRTLERELGVDLFHRTGRSVVLTSAGEAFLAPARQTLRDAATARAVVADVAGMQSGRLDLVCLPTVAVHPVAAIVGAFRRNHPEVVVRLAQPEDASAVAQDVRIGVSEVGITELPLPIADLESIELERHDFVAVLPSEMHVRTAASKPLSLSVLAKLPLVTTAVGTSARTQIDDAFAAVGLTAKIAVETDHREVILALVMAGAGIAIVPRPTSAGATDRGAVVREISPRIVRRIGLVHRCAALSPAAAAFVALALAPPAP